MRRPSQFWHSPHHWPWSWPRTDRMQESPPRHRPPARTRCPRRGSPDTRAITDLARPLFVKAYNAKDAKAIGELFTPEAEIEDEDGDITRGHDAIVARFADTFAGGETGTLSLDTESLRLLGTDLAIEEGTASLSTGTDTPPSTNRYSVIYAPAGRLHARRGSATSGRKTSPRMSGSGNSNGCSESGSTRATTRWSSPPASGRTMATTCSGTST